MYRAMIVVCWLAGTGIGFAQHSGHQMPAQAAAADPTVVTACVESQKRAADVTTRMNQRLEAARQTNNPADMRAALDELQAALAELTASLRSCDPLQSGGHSDPHAGHAMGQALKPTGQAQPAHADHAAMGHAGHQDMRAPATEPTDLVCETKIDPKKAPTVTYLGKTYYFCTEADRQLFLKDPTKYLKKESR